MDRVLDIYRHITLTLLETHLIAMRNLFTYVPGHILGRRIEIHQLVKKTMVKGLLYLFLYD